MNHNQIKDNIVSLLENIIKRSEIIESQKNEKSLLDIDMAMSDIRDLYREYEKLRSSVVSDTQIRFHQGEPAPKEKEDVKITHFYEQKSKTPEKVESNKLETKEDIQEKTETFPKEDKKAYEAPKQDSTPAEQKETHKTAPINEASIKPAAQAAPSAEPIEAPRREHHEVASKTTTTNTPPPKTQEAEVKEEKPLVPKKEPVTSNKTQNIPTEKHSSASTEKEPKENAKPILGETLKATQYSVYEHLAKLKEDKSIGSRMQQKAITNLKDGIGINEKFLFINELFNGDIQAYNQAINQLNTQENIHDSFEYINSLSLQYSWNGERSSETIEKFANLVQRKHISPQS